MDQVVTVTVAVGTVGWVMVVAGVGSIMAVVGVKVAWVMASGNTEVNKVMRAVPCAPGHLEVGTRAVRLTEVGCLFIVTHLKFLSR